MSYNKVVDFEDCRLIHYLYVHSYHLEMRQILNLLPDLSI